MNSEEIRTAVDNLIGGVCIFRYRPETKVLTFDYLNDGLYRMLGTTRAAAEKYIVSNVRQMILPQDLQIAAQWITDVIADNGEVGTVFRYVTFQGALAYMRIQGNLIERRDGENRIVCLVNDCTEELLMQKEMQKQLNFMNSVINTQNRFDYNVRTDTCSLFISRSGEIESEPEEKLIPNYLSGFDHSGVHPDDRPMLLEAMHRAMRQPCKDRVEYRSLEMGQTDGEYCWHRCDLLSIAGNDGYVTHVMGLVVDITEQRKEEERLKIKADRDALTELLNKGATETLIRSEIEAHQGEHHMDALMVIDVDDFKHINDNFGHMVGDQVLHHVGEVLKTNLKGMDVAGRVGGDEFMIFLQNIKSARDTEIIASHLQNMIHEGFADKEVANCLSVSIGIAVTQDSQEDYEALYSHADSALYETKHNGKASFTIYEQDGA